MSLDLEVYVGVYLKTRLPMNLIQKDIVKYEKKYLIYESEDDTIYLLVNEPEEKCCKFITEGHADLEKQNVIKMRKHYWENYADDWLDLKEKIHDLTFGEGVFIL